MTTQQFGQERKSFECLTLGVNHSQDAWQTHGVPRNWLDNWPCFYQ